jgi:hypothetical protein
MNRFRPFLSTLVALASLILCLFVASCGTDHRHSGDGAIWFVHATDPHIYKGRIDKTVLKNITDPANKPKFQKADEDALTALFQKIPDLPQTYGPPAFLLITGDFGVDPCEIPDPNKKPPDDNRNPDLCLSSADKDIRDAQIKNLAALLAKSPVPNIYLVAGNNDVPREAATDKALKYFNDFIVAVQTELETNHSGVHLVNLTSCYADPHNKTGCSVEVPKTDYTVIGFPSQTFKNRDGDDKDENKANKDSLKLEADQVAQFRIILGDAVKDRRKILIVTHVPELDDPYLLGLKLYGKDDDFAKFGSRLEGPTPGVSAWNVDDKILTDWKDAVSSNSVVAIFAGHLHDSHQEAYRRPYSWSTQTDSRIALNKLYLAPPLSMKKQDNSVFQARGFSTITLFPGGVQQRLYWYDGATGSFTPDFFTNPEHGNPPHRQSLPRRITGWFVWLWRVNTDLDRIATFLIALLTAFLTVVALWQIPPSDDPLTKKPAGADQKDTAPIEKGNGGNGDSSPFSTRFGKTIIAGFGGLAVSQVAKALGNEKLDADLKWYYIVCFVSFFFLLLLGLNFLRAAAEALRSRVAIAYYPLARLPHQRAASYWSLRIIHWFFSLRVPLLTFFDTFINLIQGNNQTTTKAFSDALIEQQHNVVRVADALRKKLNTLLQSKLMQIAQEHRNRAQADPSHPVEPPQLRVNISVLSADQSNVFYISRTAGSSLNPFPKISVAWVSVFTGKIRWYESFYRDKHILLFENSDKTIPDAPKKIMLDSYYEDRHDDYAAFIVIPVPQPHRGFGSNYVKGAIHISFGTDEDFGRIWKPVARVVPLHADPAAVPPTPAPYPNPEHMLGDWCSDIEIRTALNDAVAVLGELLRGFNEVIYKSYIQPNQHD